jgi:hypothetical protein
MGWGKGNGRKKKGRKSRVLRERVGYVRKDMGTERQGGKRR